MSQFIICGGKRLSGEIFVGGSKNAALPIIFACITLRDGAVIRGLPDIEDVSVALRILSGFGAEIERRGDTAVIDTHSLVYNPPPCDLVSRIRASTYLIGACLVRFGRYDLCRFGGCDFDVRPIDMHLMAAGALGSVLTDNQLLASQLSGAEIRFDKISVGATVNALIMSASAVGKTRIYGYAKEPHVISLTDFLCRAGAKIEVFDEYIEVIGAPLTYAEADIIPDMIEAGTYLALSLATDSELKISGADTTHLEAVFEAFLNFGAVIEYDGGAITLSGKIDAPMQIVAGPYPEFPSDLQPQMAPLLAASLGGVITDRVWRKRFGYLSELSEFGVGYELFDGYAKIKKSTIRPAEAKVPDLRGGAALLIAALVAKGRSVIDGADILYRGYSDLLQKLRGVGADVREV